MSETNENKKHLSTNRFMLYIALATVTLILTLFALGTTLTHFLWPPQEKLSRPIAYPKQ